MALSSFRFAISRLLLVEPATEDSGETGERLFRLLTARSPVEAETPSQSRARLVRVCVWFVWFGLVWWRSL